MADSLSAAVAAALEPAQAGSGQAAAPSSRKRLAPSQGHLEQPLSKRAKHEGRQSAGQVRALPAGKSLAKEPCGFSLVTGTMAWLHPAAPCRSSRRATSWQWKSQLPAAAWRQPTLSRPRAAPSRRSTSARWAQASWGVRAPSQPSRPSLKTASPTTRLAAAACRPRRRLRPLPSCPWTRSALAATPPAVTSPCPTAWQRQGSPPPLSPRCQLGSCWGRRSPVAACPAPRGGLPWRPQQALLPAPPARSQSSPTLR